MNTLTASHFAQAWSSMASFYGKTVEPAGCALAYQSLMNLAPGLPTAAFDYGVQQAVLHCRFMPSLADVLERIFDRDERNLPLLPNISPHVTDAHLLGIYQRAEAERLRAREKAPHDPKRYLPDCHAHLIALGVLPSDSRIPPALPAVRIDSRQGSGFTPVSPYNRTVDPADLHLTLAAS